MTAEEEVIGEGAEADAELAVETVEELEQPDAEELVEELPEEPEVIEEIEEVLLGRLLRRPRRRLNLSR